MVPIPNFRLPAIVCVAVLTAGCTASSRGFGNLDASGIDVLLPHVQRTWGEVGQRCWSGGSASDSDIGCRAPGCAGSGLLPALKLVYIDPTASGAFLDAGAHIGRWAAELISTFGQLEHRKYAKEFALAGDPCPLLAQPSVSIYCLEPAKDSFDRLTDRAKRSGWQLEGFNPMRAGVDNVTGKVNFWASPHNAPDPSASMSLQEGVTPTLEKMVTIDLLLKKTVSEGRVFLTRLAVNGHELRALQGAKKSLKKRLLGFVMFEVSNLWQLAGHSAKDAVSLLWKARYACFALLPSDAVPISGPFWASASAALVDEHAAMHVLCGAVEDPGLRRVLRAMYPEAPDYLRRTAGASSADGGGGAADVGGSGAGGDEL